MNRRRASASPPHGGWLNRADAPLVQAALAATIVLGGMLILLWAADVPLGCPGRFIYRYSELHMIRAARASLLIALGVALGGCILTVASSRPSRRRAGLVLAALLAVAIGVWTYFAPPWYYSQHFFNVHSPSHDGAFAIESKHVTNIRRYLSEFPQRARTPPEEMRGTRVISNPPGITLLAAGIDRALSAWPGLAREVTRPVETRVAPEYRSASIMRTTGVGMVMWWVLSAAWLLALAPLYGCARLWLPPAASAALACCAVFTPATLTLAPGKDAAQLLTTALPLWLWLIAWRRRSALTAAAAGALVIAASLVSLVHLWLAAVAVAASIVAVVAAREGATSRPAAVRAFVWRCLVPAVAGAGIAVLLLAAIGCDWAATVRAVAAAQAQITRGPDAMPLAWQVLGVPLFLLLCGPALYVAAWAAGATRVRGPVDPRSTPRIFGFALSLGSAMVMLLTVGFTNIETPRLWIPFVPLLLLGLWLLGAAQLATPRGLAVLVAAQLACAAVQWSRLDMRETEWRVLSGEMYGQVPPTSR